MIMTKNNFLLLIFISLGLSCVVCKNEKQENFVRTPTFEPSEFERDTIKEQQLFDAGKRLLHGIIYDISENESRLKNQKTLDKLLNDVCKPFDSLVIATHVSVRTAKDTLISSTFIPVSGNGLKSVNNSIREMHENNINLMFRIHGLAYNQIKPIKRNGIVYNNQVGLHILTDNDKSNRQVWIDIYILAY